MTGRRFAQLLRRFGPVLERWPETERAAATRALRASARCRRAYLSALDAEPPVPLDPALAARMAEQIRWRIAREPVGSMAQRNPRIAAVALRWGALAACALLGVWVGRPEQPAAAQPTMFASLQLTAIDSPPEWAP